MKTKLCALLLALAMLLSLTACRFTFELGGIRGGVGLELEQKAAEGWHTASPPRLQKEHFWVDCRAGVNARLRPCRCSKVSRRA